MMRKFWLVLFYGFANHLPDSYTPVWGGEVIESVFSCASAYLRSAGKYQQ